MNPYESGAVIDMNMGHNSATPVAPQSLLSFAPQLGSCDTPEPSLSALIYRYYRTHVDDRASADAMALDYIRALASAAQPAEAVAYGLEAWVDGAWHLQWPLRPTEAGAEKDRAMYSADAKLRLVRLSAAAPKAAPAAVVGPAAWMSITNDGAKRLWNSEPSRLFSGEKLYVLYTADQVSASVAAERERHDQLHAFAKEIMHAWPDGGIDGGELQDIALAHGLLRMAEPPTDWDGCNFYEKTELIK